MRFAEPARGRARRHPPARDLRLPRVRVRPRRLRRVRGRRERRRSELTASARRAICAPMPPRHRRNRHRRLSSLHRRSPGSQWRCRSPNCRRDESARACPRAGARKGARHRPRGSEVFATSPLTPMNSAVPPHRPIAPRGKPMRMSPRHQPSSTASSPARTIAAARAIRRFPLTSRSQKPGATALRRTRPRAIRYG